MSISSFFEINFKLFDRPAPEADPKTTLFEKPSIWESIQNVNIPRALNEKIVKIVHEDADSTLGKLVLGPLSKIEFDGLTLHSMLVAQGVADDHELNEAEKAKLDTKFLAHATNYTPEIRIDGKSFQTGGMHVSFVYNTFAANCECYFEKQPEEKIVLNQEQRINIFNSIRDAGNVNRSCEDILSSINKGEWTFIRAGWGGDHLFSVNGHSISIGFYGDKMFIGNTGQGIKECKDTFKMFQMNPSCMSVELIEFILELNSMDKNYAQEFIYDKLLQIVEAKAIINPRGDEFMPIGNELVFICLPNQGEAGNCVFGAAKSSLLFAATALAFNDPLTPHSLYFNEYKRVILYNALHTLRIYCEGYYDAVTGQPKAHLTVMPLEFLRHCWTNVFEELQSCRRYIGNHAWIIQESIDLVEKHFQLGIFTEKELKRLKTQSNLLKRWKLKKIFIPT
jgi:hypothetical protein